ncbi:MAG: DUF2127 domain-containing protein [Nitrospiraceae bacterium]|nr:DUF2127 domain-containing protein [Nitrospiraceae bacterium]
MKKKIFSSANIKQILRAGKFLHESFLVTLVLKGIFSFLEIIGGVLLFFISPAMISRFVKILTQHELSEDPHDFLFSHLVAWSHHFSVNSEMFAAIYLISHGAVKLFIVASLWRRKLWAYPTGIVFFFIFIAYQIYRFQHTHAIGLIVLTVFDLILIYLTWVEYRRVKRPYNTVPA